MEQRSRWSVDRAALTPPPFVKVVPVVTAKDMYRGCDLRIVQEQDIIIKAAAVADYRPAQCER